MSLSTIESGEQLRVTLYVRSLCSTGAACQQNETINRLQAMDEAGHIDELSIEVWGKRIPLDAKTTKGNSLLDRIETFEAWSDRAGTSLSSTFEKRTSGSLVTDGTREMIIPPMICLAEYHNGSLQYVTPCVDGGTVRTVADRLNILTGETHEIK